MISAGTNRFTGILGNTEMSCAPISIFGRLNKYFRCILVIDSFNEPRSVGFNWKIPSDFFFFKKKEKMWFKVNEFEWLIIGVNHGYEEFIYLWAFYRIISIIPVAVRIWFFQPKKKKIWKKKMERAIFKNGRVLRAANGAHANFHPSRRYKGGGLRLLVTGRLCAESNYRPRRCQISTTEGVGGWQRRLLLFFMIFGACTEKKGTETLSL